MRTIHAQKPHTKRDAHHHQRSSKNNVTRQSTPNIRMIARKPRHTRSTRHVAAKFPRKPPSKDAINPSTRSSEDWVLPRRLHAEMSKSKLRKSRRIPANRMRSSLCPSFVLVKSQKLSRNCVQRLSKMNLASWSLLPVPKAARNPSSRKLRFLVNHKNSTLCAMKSHDALPRLATDMRKRLRPMTAPSMISLKLAMK